MVAQAQLSALVVSPAPDVAFGIDGQAGVEGHHVNGQRGDLHPRWEAHPHRLRERVPGRAVAQLARVAQPPRVDAAVGQQGVLARVRRGHLRDRAWQPHRRRGGGHVLGLECAGPPEERAPVPDGAGHAACASRDCAARRDFLEGEQQGHRAQARSGPPDNPAFAAMCAWCAVHWFSPDRVWNSATTPRFTTLEVVSAESAAFTPC